MRKTMLLGQAPAKNMRSRRPFDGDAGRRLEKIAGLDLHAAFELSNLVERFPGRLDLGKGDRFPAAEARERVKRLFVAGRRVILTGRGVAAAWGMADAPFLRWRNARGAKVSVLPHPSGLNHWYNDPSNRRKVRRFLRKWARA